MGLNLKVLKKVWDQVNPLDNGRTYQNSQGNNKPGVKAPSAMQQAQHIGTGVGLAGARSFVGTAQGAAGLYDLATPGKGTNRASKLLDSYAKNVDATAKAEGISKNLYRGAQLGTDLLQFATGAGAVKAATKIPVVAKVAKPVVTVSNKVNKVMTPFEKSGNVAERVISRTVKTATKPGNVGANVAYTGLQSGAEASKGRKVTAKEVATNLAAGTAMDGGMSLVPALAREVPAAVRGTGNLVKKGVDGIGKFDEKMGVAGTGAKPEIKAPKAEVTSPSNPAYTAPKPQDPKQAKQIVQEINKNFKTKFKEKIVDEDAYIIDNLANIEKQTGQTGLVDGFLYHSGIQRRSNSIATHHFENSPHIKAAFEGLDKNGIKRFSEYANARRELSYSKDKATSASRAELKAIKDQGHGEFGARFKALNNHYKELADLRLETGLLDPKTHAAYKKNNNYVRLQRDMEDLANQQHGSGNTYSAPRTLMTRQKVKGSQREVLPVANTTLDATQRTHNEITRNKTASNIVDTLVNAGQAKRVPAAKVANKNIITRWKGGKLEYYEVSKDMKTATERINPFQLDAWGQILSAPGRVFRAGTTGLSAPFTATNYIRDQAGSAIMSKSAMATHNPKHIAAGLGAALKDGFGVDVKDPIWSDFIKHAGDQTSYDLTRNTRSANRVIRKVQGDAGSKTINIISNPIRTLEDLNSITEKATRFQNFKGIYNKAIKEGKDHDHALQEATMAAWQNSVDFNRVGQWSRVMNLLVPYWNPGVQGTRQLIRSTKNRPVATIAKTAGGVMAPVLAATLWNLSDPERAKVYNNLSDYEKENNLIVIPPGTKAKDQNADKSHDVWKIPLPPGVGSFAGMGRRAIESHANQKPQDIAGMVQDVLGAVSGPIATKSASQFGNSFVPQAAKPVINQLRNKDSFTGNQIVPDYIEKDTHPDGTPIAEKDKKYKFSSGTAEIIGNATNKSPIRIEKAVKDVGGTFGLNILNAADNVLAKAGKISSDNIGGISAKEGFSRRFAKAQGVEDFHATDAQKHFADVEKAIKSVGLNAAERKAYDLAHPQTKNSLGEAMNDKTPVDPILRAASYIKYSKLWEVDKQADAMARKRGAPGNPMYDLNPDQRKTLLAIQVTAPGGTDAKRLEFDNPWLKDYYKASSAYFDKVIKTDPKAAKAAGVDPIWKSPVASDEVSRKLAAMGQITDSKAKSAYIKENPDLTDFLAKADQATRAKRAWIGLPQFDAYPTPSKELEKTLNAYNALPTHDGKKGGNKSRYLFIQAHPELANWFDKVGAYSANEDAKINMYEGPDKPGSSSSSGGSSSSSSSSGYSSYSSGGSSRGSTALTDSTKYMVTYKGEKPKVSTKAIAQPTIKAARKASAKGKSKPKVSYKKAKA